MCSSVQSSNLESGTELLKQSDKKYKRTTNAGNQNEKQNKNAGNTQKISLDVSREQMSNAF